MKPGTVQTSMAVFPNALSRDPAQPSSFSGNPQLWNDGSDRFYPDKKAPDDILFIHAMLDDLLTHFGADARRVIVCVRVLGTRKGTL